MVQRQLEGNPTKEQENFRIGVAVADKPTGPFKELFNQPVFDPGYPIIDANILFDDASGKTYLYYSRCCYKHAVDSEVSTWAKERAGLTRLRKLDLRRGTETRFLRYHRRTGSTALPAPDNGRPSSGMGEPLGDFT